MRGFIIKSLSVALIAAAFTLPTQAFAGCGQMNGSFVVSCENGVKVYRHQAKSSAPVAASYGYVQPRYSASAERRADVALQLEARRVRIEERRQRAEETDLIRTQRGFNRRIANRRFVAFGGARGGRLTRVRGNY
jgi:hypothetical protein